MSTGYTKLFHNIIHSTVWREPDHVRIVWVTMLAMSDADGLVSASLPGLADAARVSLQQCQDALERLKAPDPHSRTPDFGGRRIADVTGGWLLLNREKYRDLQTAEEKRAKAAERARRYREKKKKNGELGTASRLPSRFVTENNAESLQAEAEAEANPSGTRSRAKGSKVPLPEDWEPNETARKKAEERGIVGQQLSDELDKFRRHFRDINPKRRTIRGWHSSWLNWLANVRADRPRRGGLNQQPGTKAEGLKYLQ